MKRASAAVTSNGPDDVMVNSAQQADQELAAAHCLSRAGDCAAAWTMLKQSKMGAVANAAMYKNYFPHCKDYTPPAPLTSGPNADPAAAQAVAAAAMTSATTKMYKKDGSCLADLDTFDRSLSDPAQRSANASSSVAQLRSICLMLSSRCDEGERLQRASLTQKKVSSNIVDLNVKSLRSDWCK